MEEVPSLEACRICANFYVTTSEVDFFNIFEPAQQFKNEMIFIESELRAWQLNIAFNDGLPQRICGNCFTKFCSIYAFREECIEAQQKLLQAFVEGDCAEEVVTAQDTTFNDLLPSNLDVNGEDGIVGLESMLVGGHVEEQVVKAADIKSEVAERIATNPTADVALPKQAERQSTISAELPQQTQTLVEEDLEEVLHGNYIPKKIKIKIEGDSDEESEEEITSPEENDSMDSDGQENPLACQYCFSTQMKTIIFRSDEALSQHFFDAHDPTYPYTCPECPQTFNNSKMRLHHVKEKHQRQYLQGKKDRTCHFCGKNLNAMTREEHIASCTYLGDWECKECGLKFQQVTHQTFKSHQQREHFIPKKQMACKDCNRVFTQRSLFDNHMKLHKQNAVLWCNECKEAFADTYELKKHKYKKHNGDLPVNCEHCKKGFVTNAFLLRHLQIFHPEKVDNSFSKSFMQCTNCGMDFKSMLKLRNHLQKPRDENGKCITPQSTRSNKQNRMGYFSCPHCIKRFNVRSDLEKHMLCHDNSKRPLKCEICYVMFHSPGELRDHHEIAHLQLRSFHCEKCGKKFAYKKDLRDHMVTHEDRNIICSEPDCGFICRNEKMLNDHIRQKHRLLPCVYCNETFTQQRLKIHMRQVHEMDAESEVADSKLAASQEKQEKVVVQFVGSRATNEITLNEQLSHEYPSASTYDDFGSELMGEPDHEIVVT